MAGVSHVHQRGMPRTPRFSSSRLLGTAMVCHRPEQLWLCRLHHRVEV